MTFGTVFITCHMALGTGQHTTVPFLASLSHLAYLASAQPAVLNSSPGIAIEFFTAHLDATLEAAVLGGHSSRELLAVGVPYETYGFPV